MALVAVQAPVRDGAVDLDAIKLDDLRREHPERALWRDVWPNYRLLYKGGDELLRASADQYAYRNVLTGASSLGLATGIDPNRRYRRFLYQLDGEPDVKYMSRWRRAVYIGYIGPIVDYFRHWLFSQPPVIRPSGADAPPEWWARFQRDVDGSGKDLLDFVRDVFLDTLTVRRAGWLVGRPPGVEGLSQQAAEEAGLDGPRLTPYAAEEILDWQEDEGGRLEWVVLKKTRHVRAFPKDRTQVETYTYVDRDQWAAWEVARNDAEQEAARLVAAGPHDLGDVPFVWLTVPEGLWPTNKLAQWQIDMFNKLSMLSYGQLLSCYMQPALTSNDPTAAARVFGDGLVLLLRNGDPAGQPAEKFEWITGNVEPLKYMGEFLRDQRDEGYRVVHQMSLAVDSQAIGAIARSGVSKIEDRRASEIILCAYGGYVREALTRTANLISRSLGDGTEWVCDGFDNFQVSSLDEEMQTAALAQTLGIKSPTFNAEIQKNLATGRLLGHSDEATKQKIREEIQRSTDEASESHASGIALTPTAQGSVITVDEARAAQGLEPLPDGRGEVTIQEFVLQAERGGMPQLGANVANMQPGAGDVEPPKPTGKPDEEKPGKGTLPGKPPKKPPFPPKKG